MTCCKAIRSSRIAPPALWKRLSLLFCWGGGTFYSAFFLLSIRWVPPTSFQYTSSNVVVCLELLTSCHKLACLSILLRFLFCFQVSYGCLYLVFGCFLFLCGCVHFKIVDFLAVSYCIFSYTHWSHVFHCVQYYLTYVDFALNISDNLLVALV